MPCYEKLIHRVETYRRYKLAGLLPERKRVFVHNTNLYSRDKVQFFDFRADFSWFLFTCILFGIYLLFASVDSAEAKPQLNIVSASFKKQTLTVRGSYKGKKLPSDGLVKLYDRKLGSLINQWTLLDFPAKKNKRTFRFVLNQPIDVPCAVRLSAEGAKNKFKKVAGARKKNCSTGKTAPINGGSTTPNPTSNSSTQLSCEILEPSAGASLSANAPVSFKARLKANDPANQSLKYEWDFAGGAMERPTGTIMGEQQIEAHPVFVRDNSNYRVRLSATDLAGRRCEAAVEVKVGQPPAGLPDVTPLAQAAQQSAPSPGYALAKTGGEKVVLPFEDWTMQCGMDTRMTPNMYQIYGPQVNTVNAYVYEKGLQPKPLGADQVDLVYYAASNPLDPVGANSINSTSQNWPLGSPLMEAVLPKTEMFERFVRPPGSNRNLADGYISKSMIDTYSHSYGGPGESIQRGPDEGASGAGLTPPLNPDHGRYMPGIANPFAVNDAQSFSEYVAADNWFAARWLPVSGVDDAGRINNFPLFRIEARETGTQKPLAATDTVVTTGRDFHCRECHAKGGIAANPDTPRTNGRPYLFDPDSSNLFDREYAALKNAVSMHDFNDFGISDDGGHNHVGGHSHGGGFAASLDLGKDGDTAQVYQDGMSACGSWCHTFDFPSALGRTVRQTVFSEQPRAYRTNSSSLYHRFHGRLQYNADKTDILRDASGRYVRFDSETESNSNSLFPVKDAQGNPLPMEQNCLKCHSGQREQCYRDRMYTAGVTCYQCHGDMLAVANMFKKSKLGPDGNVWREPWVEQPECGSCHTGSANRGKGGTGGFFSAGVRKVAFDESDPSATPFQPDRFNPDENRFAVPISTVDNNRIYNTNYERYKVISKTPLFRLGKDSHGQVACSACHGSAHAIWPNRDPNANDNVTANELQGHTGAVLECSVCHTADAFAQFANIDEGAKAVDAKPGILGGPHNLHPINDASWWLKTNPANGASIVAGGWHVNYTKIAGKAGEDQCVACHGNDRLGTRLSKTPVDRQFIDDQGKPVTIKAGTPVGCQHCHTIERSCKGAPGPDCGKDSERVAETTNQPPKLTSSTELQATIGADFSTKIAATDPDGDKIEYLLNPRPADSEEIIKLDPATGDLTITANFIQNVASQSIHRPPFEKTLTILVSDSKGAFSFERVKLLIDCPDDSVWDRSSQACGALAFTSEPFSGGGIDAGSPFTYQFTARSAAGLPVTYELQEGATPGMSIDGNGLLTFDSSTVKGEVAGSILARDSQGVEAYDYLSLLVCAAPMHWSNEFGMCVGAIHITAPTTYPGVNSGEVFNYQVFATHDQNLPINYSILNAPEGMAVSASGLVTWNSAGAEEGQVSFQVVATDDQGNEAKLDQPVQVCGLLTRWNAELNGCMYTININSSASILGIDAGQTYKYHFSASHLDGLPLSYHLIDAPPGMTIDTVSEQITWSTDLSTAGVFNPILVATDSKNQEAQQPLSITVCAPPTHWSKNNGFCE